MFAEENTFEPVNRTDCRASAHQDIAGTISGEWFLPKMYAPVFAIGTSLSGWVRVTGRDFELTVGPDQPTYVDPRKITGSHCYESAANSLYVKLDLLTANDMRVEHGIGTCGDTNATGSLILER
jgi:hypothetical protein